MGRMTTSTPDTARSYREEYQELLSAAIAALTAAARLPRPTLTRSADGTWVEDPSARPEPTDWAEFVTLALAGAAANVGGIRSVLAGRPGSWEAAGVEQLLASTVGPDETSLWEHRTEPLTITLYVDELLVDVCDAHTQYQDAATEVARRYDAAESALPAIDYDHYVWWYDHTPTGEWVARDPAAPAWDVAAWRASLLAQGSDQDQVDSLERTALPESSGAWVPRSPELGAELHRLEQEREAVLEPIADLEEQLEAQRLREWTAYGEAVKARVLAAAAAVPGLAVPVEVTIDVETFRAHRGLAVDSPQGLEERLLDQAVMDTPTPADLPGTPLERLDGSVGRLG